MPLAACDPAWTAEEARDRQSPRAAEERPVRATPAAVYLPPPARHFPITDPEHWLDLCA